MKRALLVISLIIPLALGICFCVFLYSLLTQTMVTTTEVLITNPTTSSDIQRANKANDLEQRVNKIRAENHLKPLTVCDCLRKAARTRSDEMLATGTFSHTRPNGGRFFVGLWCGYDSRGENLAMDFTTNEGIVNAWMESPSHREILLSPNFTHIGIATSGTYTAMEVGY